jgi:GTPase SAR1 family protein
VRIWGWALAGVLLAAALVVFLGGDTWEIADQKASVIAMIAGLGALALASLQELRQHRTTRRPQPIDLDRVADQLAEAVTEQWRDEERIRRIHDPYPMPVHWTNAPDHADHWANIRLDPDRDDPIDLSGTLDDIADVFDRIPSQRLVVLGKPGAGKTILTTRLVLTILEKRRPGEPVPFIFPLASWNPADQSLPAWLAGQLIADIPALEGRTEAGRTVADRLLATNRILPILDGFDEINPQLRDKAIRRINRSLGAGDTLLLTSRASEFGKTTGTVNGAAAIELADLGTADIEKYLLRSNRGKDPDRKWEPLLAKLRQGADPIALTLTQVLSNPLMLTMARTAYSDTSANPTRLLNLAAKIDTERYRRRLETHLLSQFVPAVYSSTGGHQQPSWDSKKSHRWLAFLAHSLRERKTDEFAWWRLDQALRWPYTVGGLGFAIPAFLILGPVALMFEPAKVYLSPILWLTALWSFGFSLRGVASPRLTWRLKRRTLEIGFSVGFTAGAVLLLISVWEYAATTDQLVLATEGAILIGLLCGLLGAIIGLPAAITAETDNVHASTPSLLFRSDRRITLATGLLILIVPALLIGIPTTPGTGFTIGASLAVLFSTRMAWARFIPIHLYLVMTGRAPRRFTRFFQDAHNRGVLRQVGPVYQFRHVRLRDQLAAEYRERYLKRR